MTSYIEALAPGLREVPDDKLAKGERAVGEEGAPGCEVVTERLVIVGGKVAGREVFSRDRYRPRDTVVRGGTGAVAIPSRAGES